MRKMAAPGERRKLQRARVDICGAVAPRVWVSVPKVIITVCTGLGFMEHLNQEGEGMVGAFGECSRLEGAEVEGANLKTRARMRSRSAT